MILLFAFCVTPKKLLHDLIADHNDTPFSVGSSSQQQFDYSGFRCNCDNLVVESPFITEVVALTTPVLFSYGNYSTPILQQAAKVHPFDIELRGPPAFI